MTPTLQSILTCPV